ncbi:MAG: M28 family peptidase [Candidatus Eremiobacteraeota bacterium]|nr:M28 family peptidase [Candidatus Eremiobacteraeota bacterium]
MRILLTMCAVLCVFALGQSGAARQAVRVGASIDSHTCQNRVNNTLAKLEQCIRLGPLWNVLSHFQEIADDNPDPGGHGNRDTGTPGYRASVGYVAGLMRHAGYTVTIQPYMYRASEVVGTPQFRTSNRAYIFEREWFVARGSPAGSVTAALQPPSGTSEGCSRDDFLGFQRSNVALLRQSESCNVDVQVANAQSAGAAGVVLYAADGGAHESRLLNSAAIPVIGFTANAVGAEFVRDYRFGHPSIVHIDVRTQRKIGLDYNVIADSPFGDPHHTIIIDAHLDSIFGAGMLDNASGSTTILEVALNLAKTPTRNHLRYVWFGGEELGLLGSHHYAHHLTPSELESIVFDVDVDVTATPNFDILIADPGHAPDVKRFPANVVPESALGNGLFTRYFSRAGIISRPASFGNAGTDSNSLSLVGIPNSGILTQQDCCKHRSETQLWGGFLGNYEGRIPSFNGGCVDNPGRWCDNLKNNDPFILELISKSVAYVTLRLANHKGFPM